MDRHAVVNDIRFAVFVSGYGRGAIEIIKDWREGRIVPNLGLLLSTNPASAALELAMKSGIPADLVSREGRRRSEYEAEVLDILKSHSINYIFLAGYAPIIGKTLLAAYPNQILNVHPSLLPAFKGIHAIDQAMGYGVKITGVTVHVVNKDIDSGRIIGQEAVRINPEDGFDDLDRKIFAKGVVLTRKCINLYFTKANIQRPDTPDSH